MFKEKFNSEMQNIKSSDANKAKLLEQIKTEQEKLASFKPQKSTHKKWIVAVAAMLAVIIASVSVFKLPIFTTPPIEYTEGIPANVTYNQIYNLFNEIYEKTKPKSNFGFWNKVFSTGQYDMGSEEIAIDDDTEEYVEEFFDEEETETVAEDVFSGDTTKGNGNTENTGATTPNSKDNYSTTNTQVTDVDEADIVKTDGKYIYILNMQNVKAKRQSISITKATNGKLEKVSDIEIMSIDYFEPLEMYLSNGSLALLLNDYESNQAIVKLYDISDPYKPKEITEIAQSGNYLSSRVINGKLYLFTTQTFYEQPNKSDICSYVPSIKTNDGDACPIAEEDLHIFNGSVDRSYSTVCSVDIKSGEIIDTKATIGGGETIYANTKSIYIAARDVTLWNYTDSEATEYKNKTRLIKFSILNGEISIAAEGEVAGTPLNQFSMDEFGDYFRIVTTVNSNYRQTNAVYVLDKELKITGSILNIAPDERVYSVRFMGKTGYFVTFRQIDPLFAVDFSDPTMPKILSALKIPGFSNYLHPFDNGLLLGIGSNADENTGSVGNVKLSMFDISNPEKVTEKHKTTVPAHDSSIATNHKAILVSKEKNLIGFSANQNTYFIYGYSPEIGFTQKAKLEIPIIQDMYFYSGNTRGIFIGNYFYVCNYHGINSYSLSDFKAVDSIVF